MFICLVLCCFKADSDLKTLKQVFLFWSGSVGKFSLHGKCVSLCLPKWMKRPFLVSNDLSHISHRNKTGLLAAEEKDILDFESRDFFSAHCIWSTLDILLETANNV